jgi:hypothetical protein
MAAGFQAGVRAFRANHLGTEPWGDDTLRNRVNTGQCCPTVLVEEAVLSTVTQQNALECLTRYVPLENFFIVGEKNDTGGAIALWHPQVGLRTLILERDELAQACRTLLEECGVRRFRSWDELKEAQKREQWEGWDTCADYRRMQQAMEELARRAKK